MGDDARAAGRLPVDLDSMEDALDGYGCRRLRLGEAAAVAGTSVTAFLAAARGAGVLASYRPDWVPGDFP